MVVNISVENQQIVLLARYLFSQVQNLLTNERINSVNANIYICLLCLCTVSYNANLQLSYASHMTIAKRWLEILFHFMESVYQLN